MYLNGFFNLVDRDIFIVGCMVYTGAANSYELELLDHKSQSLQKIDGNFGAKTDGFFDKIRFNKEVQIKPDNIYTLKLLMKGNETKCGEEGNNSVIGPDGINFVFSDSRLSKNNTRVSIGQIPQIQYFSEQDEGRRLQVLVII